VTGSKGDISVSKAELIEKWFDDHDGEDDFWRCVPNYPYAIIGPPAERAKVIYLTKGTVMSGAVEEQVKPISFGLISRIGLPCNSDIGWLRDLIGSRELLFIGDMDPADVLIFAWLRERLQPTTITHIGINDQFISRLGVNVSESFHIALHQTEKAAVSILEDLIPDVRAVIGTKCSDLLNEGYKIELEAIVSAVGSASPLLSVAVD
jgi:hypothetical protein